jgi:hypothetical protein
MKTDHIVAEAVRTRWKTCTSPTMSPPIVVPLLDDRGLRADIVEAASPANVMTDDEALRLDGHG